MLGKWSTNISPRICDHACFSYHAHCKFLFLESFRPVPSHSPAENVRVQHWDLARTTFKFRLTHSRSEQYQLGCSQWIRSTSQQVKRTQAGDVSSAAVPISPEARPLCWTRARRPLWCCRRPLDQRTIHGSPVAYWSQRSCVRGSRILQKQTIPYYNTENNGTGEISWHVKRRKRYATIK